jgi:pimeloyl-ACP methyl ester carboxylesterase
MTRHICAHALAILCPLTLIGCGEAQLTSTETVDAVTLETSDARATEEGATEDTVTLETQESSGDVNEPDVEPSEPAPWEFTHACEDTASEVYQTPAGALGDDVALGEVVRCTRDPALGLESVVNRAAPLGVSAEAGIEVLRIAYRTQRGEYGPGVGTATVYLPSPRPQTPSPVMMLAHGSSGLADICAPSKDTDNISEMALPFAGNDMIVVAPDYAGLGNEGTQGYRDNRDTTYSALDAVRAIYQLITPEQLTGDYYAMGHSQGGGVVLYSQALSATYLPEVPFRGGVAVALGWTSSDTPSTQLYTAPHLVPVAVSGGAPAALSSLFLYADAVNHVDPEAPGIFLHPDYRDEIVSYVESACVLGLASYFKGLSGVTFEDILDPAFLAGSLSCLAEEPDCTEPYLGHIQRTKSQYLKPDPDGAPVLILVGMKDMLATPAKAACSLQVMANEGFEPQVCVDMTASHMGIVAAQLPFAATWVRALVEGDALVSCEQGAEALPACTEP